MNDHASRVRGALAAGVRAFERLGAWTASFTFWRFVLLSMLLLIAAATLDGVLFSPARPSGPKVTIIKDRAGGKAAAPEAPAAPDAPKPADAARRACEEDVRIDWSGVHVKKRCPDAGGAGTEGTAADKDNAGDEDVDVTVGDGHPAATPRRGLDDWMLAVLAVLWVAWFVGRARRKAEARADQAEALAEKEALERQVAEARLQALQAQVEPHFLFNTLGAVEHLIETDPPRAATMQRHLIAFLRGAMPRMRGETVTLGDEIELCRNYLAIMKIRMEDRLDYAIDLPSELTATPFPPMMLQSVVENAIKHGLEPKAEGGSIMISARAAAGRLRVAVADSGLGFGDGNAATAGTGVGLTNIRERLRGLFGDRAALVISPNAPTGSQVVIEIPHDKPDGDHR